MKKLTLSIFGLVLAIALLVAAPGQSAAAPMAMFTAAGSGYLSWAGPGTPLTGQVEVMEVTGFDSVFNVTMDSLIDSGSPYAGSTAGIMTFTTGNQIGTNFTWAGGGSFSISGGSSDLGISTGSALLKGTGTLGEVTINVISGAPFLEVVFSSLSGSIHPTIAAAAGFGTTSVNGYMNIGFNSDTAPSFAGFTFGSPSDPNVAILGSGVVANTPVPVPPSVLLLAPGLLGLVGMRKRFKA